MSDRLRSLMPPSLARRSGSLCNRDRAAIDDWLKAGQGSRFRFVPCLACVSVCRRWRLRSEPKTQISRAWSLTHPRIFRKLFLTKAVASDCATPRICSACSSVTRSMMQRRCAEARIQGAAAEAYDFIALTNVARGADTRCGGSIPGFSLSPSPSRHRSERRPPRLKRAPCLPPQ